MVIFNLMHFQTSFAEEANKDKSAGEDLGYIKSVMDMIQGKYKDKVTNEHLIEGALKGMFGSMDPYTTYFTPKEAENFFGSVNGEYKGIGVVMEKQGDYSVVVETFPSSPAEKAGIRTGDKFIEVNGKSVVGSSTEEISSLIKGPEGKKVVLKIQRSGESGFKEVEMHTEDINLDPVTDDIRGDIGYIRLDSFTATANNFMTKALEKMDKRNIGKIVLDLRDNPGGYAETAVDIAKKFVPKGLITKIDYKSSSRTDPEYYSDLDKLKYNLVVLVNQNSASASELLSGAIQDTGAGKLVGTKTFGKGRVQELFPILTQEAYKKYEGTLGIKLVDVNELTTKYGVSPTENEIIGYTKITTGEYLTPKGRSIDGKGLEPDYYVENYKTVKDVDVNSIQKLILESKPSLNSESVDVYNAEKILTLSGYDVDRADLKLDGKTFKAIAKFQKDHGLYSYGKLDFATQKELNKMLEKLIMTIDTQYAKAVSLLKK